MVLDLSKRGMILAAACCISPIFPSSTSASIAYTESSLVGKRLHVPVYEWSNPNHPRRVVILALHGFMLHGGKFDNLARHLADQGAIVFAPDLRGFGRRYVETDKWPDGNQIDHNKSKQDALSLLRELRSEYPVLPIICLGESMGANLSLSVAAERPDLVDGLILSSPCIIKSKTFLRLRLIRDALVSIISPRHQINLTPYAEKFVSEESLNDPLVRRKAGVWEIWRTLRGLKTNLNKASQLDSKIQVLVLRGSDDKLCRYDAVKHLTTRLASSCKILRNITNRGHLLLEDPASVKESEGPIEDWLNGKLCNQHGDGISSATDSSGL